MVWELDYKQSWTLKNLYLWTVILVKTTRRSNQSMLKEITWVFIGKTDVEAETPALWPPGGKSWVIWKTLMLGKIEGRKRSGHRGCNGWIPSPTQWKWVWVNSGSWWWTGKPSMLQSMGSQRVRHNWAAELNWNEGVVTSISVFLKSHRNVNLKYEYFDLLNKLQDVFSLEGKLWWTKTAH